MAIGHSRTSNRDDAALAAGQTFTGTTGNDRFIGTTAADTADLSQGGRDIFSAGGGDDFTYMGGAFDAADRINGGAGYDILDLDGDYAAGITLGATSIAQIEEIGLYGGHDYRLTLADANVAALGSLFIRTVDFTAADRMYIDGSAETNGDLILYGAAGNDTLIGGAGNDLFRTAGGNDIITGGAGIDRISFAAADVGVTVNLAREGVAQNTGYGIVTLSGIESLSGSAQADVLYGTAGDNQIFAGGGNDRINGGGGDDWLIVGAGYDGVLPTAAVIAGSTGRDIIDFFANSFDTGGVTFSLAARGAQDTGQGVFTVTGMEDVAGTSFADTLTGNAVANTLYGNAGGDTLIGGNGNDALYGDGYLGTDRPSNTGGAPVMFEAAAGNDRLIGGAGADVLTGGGGNDAFVYQRTTDSQAGASDRIADFSAGDILDVRTIDANTALNGNQAFHLGETAGHTGDIAVSYDSSTNMTTLAFYTDSDNVADMTIRLDGNHDLTPGDFLF